MINDVLISVQPRKISWLISDNEWGYLEEVIKYNCCIIGGYYNIILPLDKDFKLDKVSSDYLLTYDPDLIILPPNMDKNSINIAGINPFTVVAFNDIHNYVNFSRDGMSNTENLRIDESIFATNEYPLKNAVVAVASTNDDYNNFALIACGEVFYSEELVYMQYEEIKKSTFGYREEFLKNFVLDPQKLVRKGNGNEPNRFFLNSIIEQKNRFPLNNPISAIEMCLRIQERPINRYTFCNMASKYCNHKKYDERDDKFVVLLSNNFTIKEATMFWNLRASGRYVSWISFDDLEKNIEHFIKFIINTIYEFESTPCLDLYKQGLKLISERTYSERLENIVNKIDDILIEKRYEDIVTGKYYDEYNYFDYDLPCFIEKREFLNNHKINLSYNYRDFGTYTVKLKSGEYMFPYNKKIESLINNEYFKQYTTDNIIKVPIIRISRDNFITVQVSDENDYIVLNQPNLNDIVNKIFVDSGYGKLTLSSTGKYHKLYIELCNGFEYAIKYLKESPYKEVIELLANNNSNIKTGWLLEHLGRRILNMFEIFKLLYIEEPKSFEEVYRKIDFIPSEIFELHEKGILEKGVVLTCKECSYKFWYYIDEIGQKFKCSRCGSEQHYNINPVWSYKLNEIVFQGLNSDMQVPLVTIDYLKHKSEHDFKCLIDSDFINTKKNLDIICSIDGKVYIGEAKSCDFISDEQFAFYLDICTKTPIDGVVFSTSKDKWNNKTLRLIENLKKQFNGEVIVLTYDDLYGIRKQDRITTISADEPTMSVDKIIKL